MQSFPADAQATPARPARMHVRWKRTPHAGAAATFLILLGMILLPTAAEAQLQRDAGTVATGLLLRQLDGVKRVLMVAAHPDDEDTGFLTQMARGLGAEAAYLSLTRGGGGQNLIGPELFEGLGVIRTGELEAARALDGGSQLFTRAFDFGYSKTAEESLTMWPRDELLADVVWAMRTFRPQVVVSVFSGTPSDGHGQHQAAGIVTREAFGLAGDPEAFPEQLRDGVRPWRPAKLLETSRRRFLPDAPPVEGEIVVPIGAFDPLLGRSSFQLAMESRSQHRSQDMGAAEPPGPRNSGVVVVASNVPDSEEGVFSGVDTTLVGLVSELPPGPAARAARSIGAYRSAVASARVAFAGRSRRMPASPDADASATSGVVAALTRALSALDAALDAAEGHPVHELERVLVGKRALVERTLAAASGIVFDVRADDDLVVPGEIVEVEASLWNGGHDVVRHPEVALLPRADWPVRRLGVDGVTAEGAVAPGTLATWRFEVEIPTDAEPSRLYHLAQERDGGMYRWPDDRRLWGLPRDPERVRGALSFALGEGPVSVGLEKPWRYVGVDQALGELVEPVLVLPAISVRVSPGGMAWPRGSEETRTISVVVRTEAEGGARGNVRLDVPPAWSVSPKAQAFQLTNAGQERSLTFEVTPTGTPEAGTHRIRAVAMRIDGRRYDEGFTLIDYPHIERAALFEPAVSEVAVVPVRVRPGLRVGYVMGTGDEGHEAIRQMGVDVELVSEERVRSGDFDGYDVLVLGVRAYEAREDVRAANEQILDFARAGGVVINQYNQYQFSEGAYAPHRLVIGRPAPRVSVETQPVRILEPESPVFDGPNRITDEDFDGWVQERGLYFASEWAEAYVPMLEMNDPGEPPRRGSVLVASVGEGVYAYVALSFFRQWSQRVPGAYRLLANLISLDPEEWRAFEAR
jgi:LmbE family N-acetylglucosaminyl deacetylase